MRSIARASRGDRFGHRGIYTFERQHTILMERGPDKVSPFFIPMMIADMPSGYLSIAFGLKGPNYATVSACASAAMRSRMRSC